MAFLSKRGTRPRGWSPTLQTPFLDGKPPLDEKEGMLLRQVRQRTIALGVAALVTLGLILHSMQLSTKVHPEVRTYIVEVAEPGQVRTVGLVPVQSTYVPRMPQITFVLKYWLRNVRQIGDSKVILGQNWAEALAFTAPELQDWLRRELHARYQAHWTKKEVVQVKIRDPLPISVDQQQYKVSWEEEVILPSGDLKSRQLWEAAITVRVVPITTEKDEDEARRNWRNGLGILVNEIHWLSTSGERR